MLLFAVLGGGAANLFFEDVAEVFLVVESGAFGDVEVAEVGVLDKLFGAVDLGVEYFGIDGFVEVEAEATLEYAAGGADPASQFVDSDSGAGFVANELEGFDDVGVFDGDRVG